MKRKFRSISWQIWYAMTGTVVIVLVLVLFANITIMKNLKNQFIFEQLQQEAKLKRDSEKSFIQTGNKGESLQVAHFKMKKDQSDFNVIVDEFTKRLYVSQREDEHIIQSIVDKVASEGLGKKEGVLNAQGESYFYYVDWETNGSSAMVFLTTNHKNSEFPTQILVIMMGLLLISFFTSRIVAKRIAKPIQELEVFTKEISKRNWKALVPRTNPDEIGVLAESLEKMRDSLKIAEERDRQFLQSTSHDLKTPVMIIKGYAQAMLDGMKVDTEEVAAQVIKSEAMRLERKITQLLRLNTLGHSLEYQENREIVRVDRIIKSLVSRFSVVRPDLNWKLDLRELEINGDSEALLIALENIIENQLRYAKSYISILINTDDKIDVEISNDGPCFEVKDPMELFDSYRKDKEGKFGLGLAIVKEVIEAHGGTVTAYNLQNGIQVNISFKKVK